MALGDLTLEEFFSRVSQSQSEVQIEQEAKRWIADNLVYETKKAIAKKQNAQTELEKVKKQTFDNKLLKLKKQNTGDDYGDEYNRRVCKCADQMSISLSEANEIVRNEIYINISSSDMESFLVDTYENQALKRLNNLVNKCQQRLSDPEKAFKLASILFELDLIKTDEIWNGKKFKESLFNGLNGETINLVTMLCLINEFDYNGGYQAVPNLNAYKTNSKLEAIPLILNELNQVKEFFEYYQIDTTLIIFVADTDYTEIGQYGPVSDTNLKNIELYIQNLDKYLVDFGGDVIAIPISEVTNNSSIYWKVKTRILKKVISLLDDDDFSRKWSQRFETSVERINESQDKKKLYPKSENRAKSLEIIRKLWAVNAAQGAVIADLGPNTVMISTEKRERDTNYVIDDETEKRFIPVLYILKAAEEWNRKLQK